MPVAVRGVALPSLRRAGSLRRLEHRRRPGRIRGRRRPAGTIPGERIAIDVANPAAPYATLERLRIALDARIIGGLIDDVRLVKSAAEIDIMRRSAEISDAAIEAGFAVCAPGVADSTIAATTMATLAERGSAMFSVAPIVAIGWRSGVPHSSWGGSILGAADPAFIELGAAVGRYTVPLMRTRCFEPTAQILRLAHFSNSCIGACMERTRPGVRICDIVQAGLDALKPIRGDILFHDTLGYSLGVTYPPAWLDHPGFILTLANTARIEEDMVFHFPSCCGSPPGNPVPGSARRCA